MGQDKFKGSSQGPAILKTKLYRPTITADILPRDRLLDKLNAGLQRPLTLISAPAGYGKRIWASRWLEYPFLSECLDLARCR